MVAEVKRMRIGVIDSNINLTDPFFREKRIKVFSCSGPTLHGTNVLKVLYKIVPRETEIVVVAILGNENKSSLKLLNKAIKICLNETVDIINISLGFEKISNSDECIELKMLCEESVKQHIQIFAAYTNNMDAISYPASFPNVIGIKYNQYNENLFTIERHSNDIVFSSRTVAIRDKNHFELINGNSYIAPYISAIYAVFRREKKNNIKFDFYKYLNKLKNDKYLIFNQKIYDRVKKENIIYVKSGTCSADDYLIKYFKRKNYVFVCDLKEVQKNRQLQYDCIVIGAFHEYNKDISMLIGENIEKKKNIIMLYPFIETIERRRISKENSIDIISLYL